MQPSNLKLNLSLFSSRTLNIIHIFNSFFFIQILFFTSIHCFPSPLLPTQRGSQCLAFFPHLYLEPLLLFPLFIIFFGGVIFSTLLELDHLSIFLNEWSWYSLEISRGICPLLVHVSSIFSLVIAIFLKDTTLTIFLLVLGFISTKFSLCWNILLTVFRAILLAFLWLMEWIVGVTLGGAELL